MHYSIAGLLANEAFLNSSFAKAIAVFGAWEEQSYPSTTLYKSSWKARGSLHFLARRPTSPLDYALTRLRHPSRSSGPWSSEFLSTRSSNIIWEYVPSDWFKSISSIIAFEDGVAE